MYDDQKCDSWDFESSTPLVLSSVYYVRWQTRCCVTTTTFVSHLTRGLTRLRCMQSTWDCEACILVTCPRYECEWQALISSLTPINRTRSDKKCYWAINRTYQSMPVFILTLQYPILFLFSLSLSRVACSIYSLLSLNKALLNIDSSIGVGSVQFFCNYVLATKWRSLMTSWGP